MLAQGRDELVCDFAETYHIYDMRSLPARLAATFAAGLRPDARINKKMSGSKLNTDEMLLALIADTLSVIAWQNTKDGHSGRNRPKSILNELTQPEKKPAATFDSPEAFKAWREKIMKKEDEKCPT